MSLGFNVVLALFVLAPGLAVLGGIWLGTQSGKYLPAPPPPNSLLSLALVAIGALFVHAATALIFAIGRLVQVGLLLAGQYWRSFGPLWDVPNPYVTILGLKDAVPGEGAIAMILTLFCLQSVLAFALVGHVIRKDVSKGHYTRALYGWLSDLVEKSGRPERYVTAFVLTGVEKDGRFLGYEGLLENMALTSDKQIASVMLTDVSMFYVTLEGDQVGRTDVKRSRPIPSLTIAASEIKNVAFQVFELVSEDEFENLPAEPADEGEGG